MSLHLSKTFGLARKINLNDESCKGECFPKFEQQIMSHMFEKNKFEHCHFTGYTNFKAATSQQQAVAHYSKLICSSGPKQLYILCKRGENDERKEVCLNNSKMFIFY